MNGLALFAGVGGLELGIKQLIPESRIVCYVEGEAFSASVLVSKMEKGLLHEAPIWSDVRTFNGSIFSGKVDFITAGFPCQPFSQAGKLKGKEDERWLWNDIERIISEVRPNFIFLENVSNFINGGIDAVLGTLAKFGFDAEYGCLKVSEVGGNHHRNRFFLFAYSAEGGRIMADSFNNRFGRFSFKKSCQRIIEKGRLERDKLESSRKNISNSNGFTNSHRRNYQALQKLILEQNINIRRSNYNEFQLQTITKKGFFGNFSNSDPCGIEKRSLSNIEWEKISDIIGSSKDMAHPSSQRRGKIQTSRAKSRLEMSYGPSWWQTEPSIRRVADGVAHRVDRLRACGNGVVPYQAYRAYSELIERAIKRRDLIES